MFSESRGNPGDVVSSGVGSHGQVATGDVALVVAVVLLAVLNALVLLRWVLLALDFAVRDFFVALVVVAIVGVAVVVGPAARTTSVVVAWRTPFGALCLAVTVYCPADTEGRKRKAKRPSLFAAPVATVVPSRAIETAEHRRDEQ